MKFNYSFKKCVILLVCQLALFNIVAIAQSTFQKQYSVNNIDNFNSVEQTSDSGYIFAGSAGDGFGATNVLVIKTDKNGNLLWKKNWGAAGYDEGLVVRQLKDGNFLLASRFAPQIPGTSAFYGLTKLNSVGDTIWNKTFFNNGTINVLNLFADVHECADTSIIMSAHFQSVNGPHLHILKLNAHGDTLWTKKIIYIGQFSRTKVQVCEDGGYATYNSNYIAKTDSTGNLKWIKFYKFSQFLIQINEFLALPDNSFIVTGAIAPGLSSPNHFSLTKIDSSGVLQWSKAYQIFPSKSAIAWSVTTTTDGGYLMAGQTFTTVANDLDAALIKTDSMGNVMWTKTYGGPQNDNFWALLNTFDKGFITAGSVSGVDAYIVKTDSMGVSGCNEQAQVVTAINIAAIDTVNTYSLFADSIIVSSASYGTSPLSSSVSTLCFTSGIDEDETNLDNTQWVTITQIANKTFTVQYINPVSTCLLQVIDLNGKTLYTQQITKQSATLNLSGFPNGMYILKATINRKLFTEKLFLGM